MKLYMDDIVQKLDSKDRKFKISYKKKFIEDALTMDPKDRVASVYVVVVSKEKTYDPVLNHKQRGIKKRTSGLPIK